jgi:hypothetical protein
LSSGEKAIVQYGAFLLKDKNVRDCFVALLDEPEQSLHPKWEERILQYYRSILTDDKSQIAQLFVATHSEYVIKDAYDNQDLIIILERDSEGKISPRLAEDLSLMPNSPTYNEIKFEAFGLVTPELHDELYGYFQECRKRRRISDVDGDLLAITGCPKKLWKSVNSKGELDGWSDTRSLPSFVRNYTHHPEARKVNKTKLTDKELAKSVKFLITAIKGIQKRQPH